ncbi:MAG: LTA synthase family protein [Butyrivibrio sp.]
MKKIKEILNNKFFGNIWVRLGFLAFVLDIIVESLSRHSFIAGLSHIWTNPLAFLYNCILIFFTLSFVALFKKRIFVGSLISALWITLGVVNCIMLFRRKTPFTAPDLRNITDFFEVLSKYFNTVQVVLIIALIAVAVAGLVVLAIKSPKTGAKINYLLGGLITAASFGTVMLLTNIGPKAGFLAANFGNIANAYKQYGFGYCFFSSVFNSGIDKPKDYSKETIHGLVDEVATTSPSRPDNPDKDNDEQEEYPNIIFVQLESLFDPTLLTELEFSEEPLPNLKNLYRNYSSGYLSVPSFGAGTANTEFEVITGMNLDDFGPGEYPYKTVLKDSACESICYYLKEYGYTTNALHNNSGDFYQRNTVFSRLGFDTFTSIEYIEEYDTTPMGWAKDECLIDEITGILKESEGPDFIYAISVQGHGDYPEVTEDMNMGIKVSNNDVTGNPEGFEYFVNEIHDMDIFVGNLVKELSNIDERTVVVFYGDHLPTFDIVNEDLKNGDIYQTEYVMWSNFEMQHIDRDIQAFQLGSLVMNRLGLTGGVISKLHMKYMDSEDQETYLEKLTLLEYDLLYGDCEAYGGENPFGITNLHMGYKNISINSVKNTQDENVTVTGTNYTPCSKVVINGELYSTEFVSNKELLVEGCTVTEGDKIVVVQEDDNGDFLSSTSIYMVE